jgi:hypothetical protein
MAIREFGQSLLQDVRERKDAQTRDARSYAKKQQRKELLIAGGAFLGSELFKIGNERLKQKNDAFLANSDLYSNKIKVAEAGNLLTQAVQYQENATTNNTSIYDVFLNKAAAAARTQYQKENPNAIKAGEEDEWEMAFRSRENIKSYAKDQSDYWKEILTYKDQYNKGRAASTLDSVAALQKPTSVVGSMWNKLTGDETSVDVFNSTMSALKQVTAANKIEALKLQRKKDMGEAMIKNGSDPSLARLLAGAPVTKEERDAIQRSLKLGEIRTEMASTLDVSSRGVFVQTNTKILEPGGNTRMDSTVVRKFGPNDVMTMEDIGSITSKATEIMETPGNLFNARGQQAFSLEVSNYMQSKPDNQNIVEPVDLLNITRLLLTPETWTEQENIIKPLEPEVANALIDQFEGLQSVVTDVAASIEAKNRIGNTEEASQESRDLLEFLNSGIKDLLDSVQNPTGLSENNRKRIDAFLEKNPSRTEADAIAYWKGKEAWDE